MTPRRTLGPSAAKPLPARGRRSLSENPKSSHPPRYIHLANLAPKLIREPNAVQPMRQLVIRRLHLRSHPLQSETLLIQIP